MVQDNGYGHDSLLELIQELLKAEEKIIQQAMNHFNITLMDAHARVYVLDERNRKTYYMDGIPAIIVNRTIDLDTWKGSITYTELYKEEDVFIRG